MSDSPHEKAMQETALRAELFDKIDTKLSQALRILGASDAEAMQAFQAFQDMDSNTRSAVLNHVVMAVWFILNREVAAACHDAQQEAERGSAPEDGPIVAVTLSDEAMHSLRNLRDVVDGRMTHHYIISEALNLLWISVRSSQETVRELVDSDSDKG